MDQSTRILIDKIGIALSLILGSLAVVGEFLGWWNDAGVVLSVFSLILGVLSVVDINGSRILDELRHLAEGERLLQQDHHSLSSHHGSMIDNQGTMIDNQETVIDHQASIRAKLDSIEQILDERLPSG